MHAAGRRFAGAGQGHGLHAGSQHSVRSDPHLLVLLRTDFGMEHKHRRRGPNFAEFQPHGRTFRQHPLHQTFRRRFPRPFMPRYAGGEGREDLLAQDYCDTRGRPRAFLFQLVAA